MAKVPPALASLSKLLKNGKPKVGTPTLPDGTYQGEITDIKLGTTQKGKPQIDWTLKVLSGEYEGRACHKYDMLATQENVDWVYGTLEVLGVDELPTSLDDFKTTLQSSVGKKVEFSCRTQGNFTNVYINELLETVEDEDYDEDDDEEDWTEGTRVIVKLNSDNEIDEDGEEYSGTITSVNEKKEQVSIEFDDGDTLDKVPFEGLVREE